MKGRKTTCCILLGAFFWLLELPFTCSVKIICPASAELVTTERSRPVMMRLLALESVKIRK